MRRKADGNRRQASWPFVANAHETNDVGANWLIPEGIRGGGPDEVVPPADYDFGFKWQSAAHISSKPRMTGAPANHEGSGRANIDHIIVFQLSGQKGWTKSFVSANVATPEENHERHRPNETQDQMRLAGANIAAGLRVEVIWKIWGTGLPAVSCIA